MLAGYPPFYDDNPLGIYQKIMDGYYEFPPHIEPKARDLIKSFLCADRSIRLGCSKVSLYLTLLIIFIRMDLTMLKLINGSEELNGRQYLREKFHHHGCLKSEMPLTHNTSIDMQSLQRLQACHLKSNKNTS